MAKEPLSFPRKGHRSASGFAPLDNKEEQDVDTIEPMKPREIIPGLYTLFIAKVICQDAYNLGCHVVRKMEAAGVDQIIMTGEEASQAFCMRKGMIFSGPITRNLSMYVAALQDLQFRGALFNDMSEKKLYDGWEAQTRHFTLSPILTAGRHYSFHTPIYYRLAPIGIDEFWSGVDKLCALQLTGCEMLNI